MPANKPRLDRTQPYGEIRPPWNTAVFSQDNNLFDRHGRCLDRAPDGSPIQAPVNAPVDEDVVAAEAAKETQKPPRRSPARRQAKPARGGRAKTAATPEKAATGAVNLVAWARGEEEYLFAKVRDAVKARFSKVVTDETAAVRLLVEEGVVDAGDVTVADVSDMAA